MPGGVGGIAYLSDEDENVTRVSQAGRVFQSESYSRVKKHSPINVTAASGGSTFETVAVGKVILRSESGNNLMWWGGTGDDAPYQGRGMPLWGGEQSQPIPVTNFNTLRVVAQTSGQIVYAIGFLNGTDAVLSNTVPTPWVEPDLTKPLIITHSPVSGFSGVALNAEISVDFDEDISETSVTSGTFDISPSHSVNVFRDVNIPTKIVMSPNANFSGTTVYTVSVNTGITDLAGNSVSGAPVTWPFTTTAAPPPPDTTAPVISGTTPASGTTNVSHGANVIVLFSEAMLSGTVNQANLYLSYISGAVRTSGISGVVSLSAVDQKTTTIDPVNNFSGSSTVYINALSGLTDLAGNNLVLDRLKRFTTAVADVTRPVVSGTSPVNNATNVAVGANIIVTFSEPMLSGTINTSGLYLSKTSGGSPNPSTYSVQLSGNKIGALINPGVDLDGGYDYYINVKNTVSDLVGNTMLSNNFGNKFSTLYNFQEVYNITGASTADIYSGDDERAGMEIVSTTPDIFGIVPKRVTMRLSKTGSPTGTATLRIRDSSDSIVSEIGTLNVASLTTSFADITITNMDQSHTIDVDDKILLEYSGGNSSNKVNLQKLNSDGVTGTRYVRWDGSYTAEGGQEIAWIVYS